MQFYNKIMLYFWLFAAVLIFVVVTYKGVQEDFTIWGYYYLFGGLALVMFCFGLPPFLPPRNFL